MLRTSTSTQEHVQKKNNNKILTVKSQVNSRADTQSRTKSQTTDWKGEKKAMTFGLLKVRVDSSSTTDIMTLGILSDAKFGDTNLRPSSLSLVYYAR